MVPGILLRIARLVAGLCERLRHRPHVTRWRLGLALTSGLLASAMSASAENIYVVVSVSSPVRSLNAKEAQSLYMGRARTIGAGEPATVLDLARNHPVRDAFYLSLTGLSPAQVNSYWSRLMFTGQTMPPKTLDSEQQVVDVVRGNPLAIGYLSKEPTDPSLRTVLVLKSPNSL